MILAVAERVNDPSLSDERVEGWRRYWTGPRRLGFIRRTPAMTRGNTLARLKSLIGVRPDQVMNLLWPDNKIGTWDKAEARLSALVLREWLSAQPCISTQSNVGDVTGVVLLGKRVVEAFAMQHEGWGEIVDGGDMPPVLLMPHPSGRNRLLNDPALLTRLRRAASSFAKWSDA